MNVIPKDCCLCDCCNAQLTDTKFIVTKECAWYEGYLYCHECETKYDVKESGMELIARYTEGTDISKTNLTSPIIITEF